MTDNNFKSDMTTAYRGRFPQEDVLAVSDFDLQRITDLFTNAWRGSLRLTFETPVVSVTTSVRTLDDAFKQICQWGRSVAIGNNNVNVRIEANDPANTDVPAAQLSGRAQNGLMMIQHVKAGFWPKVS